MPHETRASDVIHASCVAHHGRGLLILGASGAGKSTLALELIAFGALLVADDRVVLTATDGILMADSPESIRGQIEARGVGILRARAYGPAPVVLAVDLDCPEPQRLPPHRLIELSGVSVPLVFGKDRNHLSVTLLQYLVGGRADPP